MEELDSLEDYFETTAEHSVGETARTQVDHRNQEILRYQLIEPSDPEYEEKLGDRKEERIIGGEQYVETVRIRPRCPSCQHAHIGEDDPMALLGQCYRCNRYVCIQCGSRCEACQSRLMCQNHAEGHGATGKTLCHVHVEDEQNRIEFERRQEEMEKRMRMKEAEHQRKMEEAEFKRKVLLKIAELKQESQEEEQDQGFKGFEPVDGGGFN